MDREYNGMSQCIIAWNIFISENKDIMELINVSVIQVYILTKWSGENNDAIL